jgi:hypothetical protein
VNDIEGSNDEGPGTDGAPRLSGASAVRTHLGLLVGLALCGAAFWFELGRAEGGNALSWAYVFEWPLLALFAIYMWWKLLHPGFTFKQPHAKAALAPEYEGMLAAWQIEQQKIEASRLAEEAPASKLLDENNGTTRSGE